MGLLDLNRGKETHQVSRISISPLAGAFRAL